MAKQPPRKTIPETPEEHRARIMADLRARAARVCEAARPRVIEASHGGTGEGPGPQDPRD